MTDYPKTYYTIFSLPPAASLDELHARFRELSVAWHPDRPDGGEPELYRDLTAAWAVLKQAEARRLYDARLLMLPHCAMCHGKGRVMRSKTRSWSEITLVPAECEACDGTGQISQRAEQASRSANAGKGGKP